MVQVFADGVLIYDSRVPEVGVLSLTITKALNKGGTATLQVTPLFPHYNRFESYHTVVEIYRDGELIFRGRSLYPTDSFDLLRTFTCEGERCFLNDALLRGRHLYRDENTGAQEDKDLPGGGYLYQESPEVIFHDVIEQYNAQVDGFKKFEPGTVSVTDTNNYIRLENGEAETVAAVVDKLVERCGGYITFTEGEDGKRVINWLAALTDTAEQEITFGDNLLDFSRTTANTELATVIVPYGAVKDENTGARYTLKDAGYDKDYITAPEDVLALRGWLWKAVTWDDVTEPEHLMKKAEDYLADSQLLLTTLTLTALDLSVLDKTIRAFHLGDTIKVVSKPHGIGVGTDKGLYRLEEQTLDLLNPQNDKVTLGKAVASLTGSDVVTTMQTSTRLNKVSGTARAAYTVNAAAIAQLEQTFRSEIEQLPDRISLSVSGSLGGTASIALSVGGVTGVPATLDLSGVRQAFASDTSAVTISAGTITFNSGSIIINSSKCQLTAAGKLTVEDAVVKGEITTIEGSYRTEMSNGSLRLYYSDALCGTINTKYGSGASTEGISLRIEPDGKYIMFSHPDSSHSTGYAVDYYLNYGWSSNYDEKHIFQTSARFLGDVYLDGKTDVGSLRLRGAGGKRYLITANDNGTVTCSVL